MNDAASKAEQPSPDTKNDLATAKQQLEIDKLKLELKYIRRPFYAQLLHTAAIGLAALAALYFFQRPQIEQMESSRLASEKQQVSALAMSALALENAQDRASMLNAVHAMYPQYEFLGSLARSQTLLTQVAAAPSQAETQQSHPPKPEPPPQSEPVRPPEPPPQSQAGRQARSDPELEHFQKRREELEYLESRLTQAEEQCQKSRADIEKLERSWDELKQLMEKELRGTAGTGKPGQGRAYQSLFEQLTKVKWQLDYSKDQGSKFCAETDEIKKARQRIMVELDELFRRALR